MAAVDYERQISATPGPTAPATRLMFRPLQQHALQRPAEVGWLCGRVLAVSKEHLETDDRASVVLSDFAQRRLRYNANRSSRADNDFGTEGSEAWLGVATEGGFESSRPDQCCD
jgi:hypothetical protein